MDAEWGRKDAEHPPPLSKESACGQKNPLRSLPNSKPPTASCYPPPLQNFPERLLSTGAVAVIDLSPYNGHIAVLAPARKPPTQEIILQMLFVPS